MQFEFPQILVMLFASGTPFSGMIFEVPFFPLLETVLEAASAWAWGREEQIVTTDGNCAECWAAQL